LKESGKEKGRSGRSAIMRPLAVLSLHFRHSGCSSKMGLRTSRKKSIVRIHVCIAFKSKVES